MQVHRDQKGTVVSLVADAPLGRGGEANVYAVRDDLTLVAKIYHQPQPEQAQKLAAMLAGPPPDAPASLAWPLDLLRANGQVVGYLMPRLTACRLLFELYNPGLRRQRTPHWHYGHLHLVAHNLAALFAALHQHGLVVGDVNESNLLVSAEGIVTLIDTDSMQLRDPRTDAIYRCKVGKAEYSAPEIQSHSFAAVERTIEQDLFGLGVLLFQLLMEGTHPFAGKQQHNETEIALAERIARGKFPYVNDLHNEFRPARTAPPFDLLSPRLQQLFQQCFVDGHQCPTARPTAAIWQRALHAELTDLVTCEANAQHVFGAHWDDCPWCQRANQLRGTDPFPLRWEDVSSAPSFSSSFPSLTPSGSLLDQIIDSIGMVLGVICNCVVFMMWAGIVSLMIWMFWHR